MFNALELKEKLKNTALMSNPELITDNKFISKYDEIDANEQERQLITNRMNYLKQQQVQLMRQFKNIRDEKYFTDDKLGQKVEETRKGWIDTIINMHYETPFILAITLNFNNKIFSDLNIQSIQNRLNEWWNLYCGFHLGRDKSKYSQMNYIGFIEHLKSNIHVHLAVHTTKAPESVDDNYIYDEEQVINTLWKSVQNRGSVYVEKITDEKWFYYMTKEFGYEHRLVSFLYFFK